ncbi:MAG: glycosyltransferase family 4 protein [Acidobacteriota bacterium]|nr:MAG: glycosyltransferase family 4 protein [Acidobacteriota bacterium]
MNLAVITSHINKSLQWLWTSEGLAENGIRPVHIIINSDEPLLRSDLEICGFTVYWLRHRNTASHIWNLIETIRILRRHRIDIVHTSLPYGNLIGQLAALICGIGRRVTTCENASWADDFGSRKQLWIDGLTYRLAKRVIATSEPARRYLKSRWNIREDRLSLIGHAVKALDFDNIDESRVERLRKSLGIKGNEYIVGVVARFEYWKGHRDIVGAVKMIAADHPDLKVLIFGAKGADFDSIMGRVGELGLEEMIQYKGFVDDPLALYRLFDVHLHVPVNEYVETFGITIIEGMMSGCAQVLTRSGVACLSARDRENCMVVDYSSPEQIAEAIVELRSDPELARRIGDQARRDAIRDFDIRVKVDKHVELYRSLKSKT